MNIKILIKEVNRQVASLLGNVQFIQLLKRKLSN